MHFRNRNEAAALLAERLSPHAGERPLVLAIPRGAVPMGRIIADALDGELDVVLAAKIPAPGNPEFAIGTIAENGWMQLADWADETGVTPRYVEQQKALLADKLRKRRMEYAAFRPLIDPRGRIVIVVDDGLATGLTMTGALSALRISGPRRLIIAVPVASINALEDVSRHADEVVCLSSPEHFQSVGQFYDDFSQVSDEEVAQILRGDAAGPSRLTTRVAPVPGVPRQ
jgi:putative phosphoribosyl transferase